MMRDQKAKQKRENRADPKAVPAEDLKLLQARLPRNLVVAFRTLVLTKETTVRALLEELIRERLKREGTETESS